jgi:hypothetical protein
MTSITGAIKKGDLDEIKKIITTHDSRQHFITLYSL